LVQDVPWELLATVSLSLSLCTVACVSLSLRNSEWCIISLCSLYFYLCCVTVYVTVATWGYTRDLVTVWYYSGSDLLCPHTCRVPCWLVTSSHSCWCVRPLRCTVVLLKTWVLVLRRLETCCSKSWFWSSEFSVLRYILHRETIMHFISHFPRNSRCSVNVSQVFSVS